MAATAGAKIIGEVIQNRQRPDTAYYFGRGKVNEIGKLVSETDADLFIFDDDLSPAQVRNLEESLKIPVVDRSGLILDIFAVHARTTEAKTQVKLAQLKYLLPRLAGRWAHLERQEGAIGTRGPGETQLETDRRLIQKQISEIERKLTEIDKEREIQRRKRKSLFRITLVGYTNAGKSTILNMLTDAGVRVEDKLFATLDSTTRRLELGHGEVALLTDTVGFITKLPAHLVASFRSTLMDVKDADLLLHIVDVSEPQLEERMAVVNKELARLCGPDQPRLMVFNKIDLLDDESQIDNCRKRYPGSIWISAANSNGVGELIKGIKIEYMKSRLELIVNLSRIRQSLFSEFAKFCRILNTRTEGEDIVIRISGPREHIRKLLDKYPDIKTTIVI